MNNSENRAAVLLAMVQALSFKYGCDCLGNENDRRYLASMGPEEKFKAIRLWRECANSVQQSWGLELNH